jgi:hypothetical protein
MQATNAWDRSEQPPTAGDQGHEVRCVRHRAEKQQKVAHECRLRRSSELNCHRGFGLFPLRAVTHTLDHESSCRLSISWLQSASFMKTAARND